MNITIGETNEDGSANATIEGLTNEELIFFAKRGILAYLEDAIRDSIDIDETEVQDEP